MLHIEDDYSLESLNTFACRARARRFVAFSELEELRELIAEKVFAGERMILSGGSNVLFCDDYAGTILQPRLHGIRFHGEREDRILVSARAGEVWHELVLKTLDAGYSGLENLALIPGWVGAAPVQNIGAYGVELCERLISVEATDLVTGETRRLAASECGFGYRESIFKNEWRDRLLITEVTLALDKKPEVDTRYGALETELSRRGIQKPAPRDVFDAVCRIRRNKLPDPAELGNAGSFFKNPTIAPEDWERLRTEFPGIVGFPTTDRSIKLAAAWLIEQCGFRGHREEAIGVHEQQCLVLVNHGGATGTALLALARRIQQAVHTKFGVTLTPEVRIVSQFASVQNGN